MFYQSIIKKEVSKINDLLMTAAIADAAVSNSTPMTFGYYSGDPARKIYSKLDEICFTNGVAVYTGPFIRPTLPYVL